MAHRDRKNGRDANDGDRERCSGKMNRAAIARKVWLNASDIRGDP